MTDVQKTYGKKLPKALKDRFHLDSYGDLFFRKYTEKPGAFIGYSYCYIRKGDLFRLFASIIHAASHNPHNKSSSCKVSDIVSSFTK